VNLPSKAFFPNLHASLSYFPGRRNFGRDLGQKKFVKAKALRKSFCYVELLNVKTVALILPEALQEAKMEPVITITIVIIAMKSG
jgi:hypothetical protein